MSAPLPPCPLCGAEPRREASAQVVCSGKNGGCPIEPECRYTGPVFTEEQWRRLAAPPLPPEVVAVLRAAREWNRADLASDKTDLPLMSAVDAWLAANTPGLPPEKE